MKIVLILAALTGSVAMAAVSGLPQSEALHQTGAGQFEVTPGVGLSPASSISGLSSGFSIVNASNRRGASKTQAQTIPLDIAIEYGLDTRFAIGAATEFQSSHYTHSDCAMGCPSQSSSSIAKPLLFFKGQYAIGRGTLQYGVNFRLNLNPTQPTVGWRNPLDAGSSATPFVAYEMPLGISLFGARLAYTAALENQAAPGATLDLFYEYPLVDYSLGAIITLTDFEAHHTIYDDSEADHHTSAKLEIYAPIRLAKVTLTPNISYSYRDYSERQASYSRESGYGIGAAARFTF